MDLGPPRNYTLTPNLDRNEPAIQKMNPHMAQCATFSSGITDMCIMLARVLGEMQTMSKEISKMNQNLESLTLEEAQID